MGKFLLPFHEGRCSVRKFSPTSIIVTSFIMGVLMSIQTQVLVLLSMIGLVFLIGTFAGTSWRPVLSLATRFEIVILFWILLLPFFYGTSTVLAIPMPWGQLNAYKEGLELGVLIGLRIFGLITLFLAALSHMSMVEFIGALKTLRVPPSILGSLLIMIRYIPLFIEERHRMQDAQRLRGFERAERVDMIRSLGFVVGSTIDRAMDRSAAVYESMTLRGFGKGMLVVGAGAKRNDILLFFCVGVLLLILLNWQTLVVLFS